MEQDRQKIRIYEDKVPGASRTIDLIAKADGGIRLCGGDVGQRVLEMLGDSDWEFWVEIPASSMQGLAFALLRDRLADRGEAWSELTDYCIEHGIEHYPGEWT